MKTLVKFIVVSTLALTLTALFAVFLAVDSTPKVTTVSAASVEDAKASHKIVKTLWQNLIVHKAPFVLSVSEQEINGQFVLINRAIPRIKGLAQISQNLTIDITLELPSNPLGKFVNIHCDVLPSNDGLSIQNLSMGSLPLPEPVAIFAAKHFLDTVSGQELGTITLNAIESVAINGSQVDVSISPIPDLKARLDKTKERIKTSRDILPEFADPALIAQYYQYLMQYDQSTVRKSKSSVAFAIQHIFNIASQSNGDPVEANKAAILALAQFYGSERIGSVVGNIKTHKMNSYVKRSPNLTLKQRNDLTRHFTISAALQVMSENEFTNAIGEFKELLDSRNGGSGFSFVDLAADRAGVRFAEILLNPKTAKKMQRFLSNNSDEEFFFPNISGLPEQISQSAFKQQYQHVNSKAYIQLVKRIDNCIAELPAYALGNYSVSKEFEACKFH